MSEKKKVTGYKNLKVTLYYKDGSPKIFRTIDATEVLANGTYFREPPKPKRKEKKPFEVDNEQG